MYFLDLLHCINKSSSQKIMMLYYIDLLNNYILLFHDLKSISMEILNFTLNYNAPAMVHNCTFDQRWDRTGG